jgi:hypothetical protein
MHWEQHMTEEDWLRMSVRRARLITEAARTMRGTETFPRVNSNHVEFYEGDRRFGLTPETTDYIDQYLNEHGRRTARRFEELTLEAACQDADHVRELIEVITS